MRHLVENGRFPLLAFITCDPDQIRRHLPEYHLYVESNPELAGALTHKEAGFIAEILTLAGLQSGKNVMVDGSLRNAEWYKTYFQRLRSDFPMLRLSIIHVTAPREAIFQRAAVSCVLSPFQFALQANGQLFTARTHSLDACAVFQARAVFTGRVVPRDVLEMAIEQVPMSIKSLAPLVDYFVELKNDPNTPDIELGTEGETWANFESKWVQYVHRVAALCFRDALAVRPNLESHLPSCT
jgi:predicted ester cyclase